MIIHSQFFAPFSKTLRFATARQHYSGSFVSRLLGSCRPNAILRRVPKVIVAAFDCVLGSWPLANIGYEVCKLFPAFANRNPATAVIFPLQTVSVATSFQHVAPDDKFRRPTHHVLGVHSRNGLALQASARATDAFDERLAKYRSFSPAFTPAPPPSSVVTHAVKANDCPAFESQTRKVFETSVIRNKISINHVTLLVRVIGQSRQALVRLFGSLYLYARAGVNAT